MAHLYFRSYWNIRIYTLDRYPRAKSPWPIHQGYPGHSSDDRFIWRAIHRAIVRGPPLVFKQFLKKLFGFVRLRSRSIRPYTKNRPTGMTHTVWVILHETVCMSHTVWLILHFSWRSWIYEQGSLFLRNVFNLLTNRIRCPHLGSSPANARTLLRPI